ncbi:unnamed protein product [Cuscuta epithymum]|uniref:Uncharacterized protein n=1 Tax=Cuscuta epithymum TaxID=186058 RepID=A0AAV0FPY7_9ASTE|nr:unnamed protein product [Cuscuta epithymum]
MKLEANLEWVCLKNIHYTQPASLADLLVRKSNSQVINALFNYVFNFVLML